MAVTLTSTGITFSDGTSQTTKAVAPDLSSYMSYSALYDYHPDNLVAGSTIRAMGGRVNSAGSTWGGSTERRNNSGTSFTVGSNSTLTFRVRFKGYRQEGYWRGSLYEGNTSLAYDDRGNSCCWQTLATGSWQTFSLAPGIHTITPWLGTNMWAIQNLWMEYEVEFVGGV